jgi:hypothetical protein
MGEGHTTHKKGLPASGGITRREAVALLRTRIQRSVLPKRLRYRCARHVLQNGHDVMSFSEGWIISDASIRITWKSYLDLPTLSNLRVK